MLILGKCFYISKYAQITGLKQRIFPNVGIDSRWPSCSLAASPSSKTLGYEENHQEYTLILGKCFYISKYAQITGLKQRIFPNVGIDSRWPSCSLAASPSSKTLGYEENHQEYTLILGKCFYTSKYAQITGLKQRIFPSVGIDSRWPSCSLAASPSSKTLGYEENHQEYVLILRKCFYISKYAQITGLKQRSELFGASNNARNVMRFQRTRCKHPSHTSRNAKLRS